MALILKKPSETGQWFKHTIQGVEIEIKIRPLTLQSIKAARGKAQGIDFVPHPRTNEIVKVVSFDEDAMLEAQIDHIIEDARNVQITADKPFENTLENKLMLWQIKPLPGETPVSVFVFNTAREMGSIQKSEVIDEAKN